MLAATEIVDGGLLLRIHYIFDGDEYHTSSIFFQDLTTGRRWRTSCCEVAGFRITEMKKAARMSGLLAC